MTYAPPKMTSDQEVFDFVVRHLRRQGRRAEAARSGQCRYRGAEGSMCAAGCLIADEQYTSHLEGKLVWRGSPVGLAIAVSVGFEPCSRLLGSLQTTHDGYAPEEWPGYLRKVAFCHGIQDSVVLECWPGAPLEVSE